MRVESFASNENSLNEVLPVTLKSSIHVDGDVNLTATFPKEKSEQIESRAGSSTKNQQNLELHNENNDAQRPQK